MNLQTLKAEKEKVEKELIKNKLDCPYNKFRQNKEHRCSDCDCVNDILEATLSALNLGIQAVENQMQEILQVIEEVNKYSPRVIHARYDDEIDDADMRKDEMGDWINERELKSQLQKQTSSEGMR